MSSTATDRTDTAHDDGPCHAETDRAVERADDPTMVVDELLVEDVSIDGMCGVY